MYSLLYTMYSIFVTVFSRTKAMNRFAARISTLFFALIAMLCAACSPHSLHRNHGKAHAKPTEASASNEHADGTDSTTVRLADDGSGWKKSPHMREFFDT